MACSESGARPFLLCLGVLLVGSPFCHCASLTRLKALDTIREGSTLNEGQTTGSGLRHGRLLVGRSSLQGAKLKGTKTTDHLLDVDSDYQADMAWGDEHSRLSPDSAAVQRLLNMQPKVECTGDSMQLQVSNAASSPGSLFFVDRGLRLSPLPLSKLPLSCGYTIRSTQRDLVLVAPYDGCFVALEEDCYVLPLRWLGLPVKMSCPSMRRSSTNPPMVTCHAEGMVVKTEWMVSAAKINVKLRGSWEPLMKASASCGFSVVVHPEGVVISVHYAPCLEKKDGMYTLELTGDGEAKISCPSLSPAQPESTQSPAPKPQDPYQTPKPRPSAIPQAPGLPLTPDTSKGKPDQRPKVIPQPQLPYPYLYPYHAMTETKPTTIVQPISTTSSVIKTTTAPTQPYYPFLFYAQTPPPVALSTQPPVAKPPVEQPAKPSYPFVFYPQPPALVKQPLEKPVPPKPPSPKKPDRHIHPPFYPGPFYHGFSSYDRYQMPMPLKQQTFTPAPQSQASPQPGGPKHPSAYVQLSQRVTTPPSDAKTTGSSVAQTTNGGIVPPGFPQMPPTPCPQVCPSGFSNCCPQIAFHQYLHIVPASFGSKHTGFGNSLGSAHLPQNPTEPMTTQAPTTSTSAPMSLQAQAHGNEYQYLQPPDGTNAAQHRIIPSMPANPEVPVNPYVDDSLYSDWLYPAQNEELLHLPHNQFPSPSNVLLKPRASGGDLLNQMGQVDPYNVQPQTWRNGNKSPGNTNNPTGTFMSYIEQNQQQPSELGHFQDPYYMAQGVHAPTYEKSADPNSVHAQPSTNASNEYTEHDPTMNSLSEPKTYVLLQQGPPGREHNNWNEFPLPFRDFVHVSNPLEQNLAKHHNNIPSSTQKQNQQPKWLRHGMASPLIRNVNNMPGYGDNLGLPFIGPASDGSDFLPLPQEPSTNVAHAKPQFPESLKDLWKPVTPPSSNGEIPPYISGHFNHGVLQQVKGLNQLFQRGNGNQKQK